MRLLVAPPPVREIDGECVDRLPCALLVRGHEKQQLGQDCDVVCRRLIDPHEGSLAPRCPLLHRRSRRSSTFEHMFDVGKWVHGPPLPAARRAVRRQRRARSVRSVSTASSRVRAMRSCSSWSRPSAPNERARPSALGPAGRRVDAAVGARARPRRARATARAPHAAEADPGDHRGDVPRCRSGGARRRARADSSVARLGRRRGRDPADLDRCGRLDSGGARRCRPSDVPAAALARAAATPLAEVAGLDADQVFATRAQLRDELDAAGIVDRERAAHEARELPTAAARATAACGWSGSSTRSRVRAHGGLRPRHVTPPRRSTFRRGEPNTRNASPTTRAAPSSSPPMCSSTCVTAPAPR